MASSVRTEDGGAVLILSKAEADSLHSFIRTEGVLASAHGDSNLVEIYTALDN